MDQRTTREIHTEQKMKAQPMLAALQRSQVQETFCYIFSENIKIEKKRLQLVEAIQEKTGLATEQFLYSAMHNHFLSR